MAKSARPDPRTLPQEVVVFEPEPGFDPSKPYYPYISAILQALREGHSYSESAKIAGVNRHTFFSWQRSHIEFREATKAAFMDAADFYIEVLRKYAMGELRGNPAAVAMQLKLRGLLIEKQGTTQTHRDSSLLDAGSDAIAEAQRIRTLKAKNE